MTDSIASKHRPKLLHPPNRSVAARKVIVLIFILPVFTMMTANASESLPDAGSRLYIAHDARFVAEIPADWHIPLHDYVDFIGDDGFVFSLSLSTQTLKDACAEATRVVATFGGEPDQRAHTWRGQDACRLEADTSLGRAIAQVVPHGQPFEQRDETVSFVMIMADPSHLEQIAGSIDFDPERVTPRLFIESVVEILAVRNFWSPQIEWDLVLRQALEAIEGASTLRETQPALTGIMRWLSVAGDNHSYLVPPGMPHWIQGSVGYGLLVSGTRVLIVYERGPGDVAGLQIGDEIRRVDGERFVPAQGPLDPYWYAQDQQAIFTIFRPSTGEELELEITAAEFMRYAPPWGGALEHALGVSLMGVPSFSVDGRKNDFVSAGSNIVTRNNQSCGWIIDLRLDFGGSYTPMIGAIEAFLDDGVFVGWLWNDGVSRETELNRGSILDGGGLVADYNGVLADVDLSDRPVAVLLGPYTASSGEVAALAFVGRPNTMMIGTTTAGASTAIGGGGFLFDGSLLGIATAAMTDRGGATYLDGVMPQIVVGTDWQNFGNDRDPVINAAVDWLTEQPACTTVPSATPAG